MAGRKKNWNEGTPLRYKGKVHRVNRGIYLDPDIAEMVTERQASAWQSGAGLYHRIRMIAKDVMSKEDTYVSPPARVQYYAAVQKFYKDVVVMGKDEDAVRRYIEVSFPELDMGVFDAIIDALTGAQIMPRLKPAERS